MGLEPCSTPSMGADRSATPGIIIDVSGETILKSVPAERIPTCTSSIGAPCARVASDVTFCHAHRYAGASRASGALRDRNPA